MKLCITDYSICCLQKKIKISSSIFQLFMLATLVMVVAGDSKTACAWGEKAMESVAKVRTAAGCEKVCRGVGSCTHYTWTSGDVCVLVRSKVPLTPIPAPTNFVCGFIKGRSTQTF